MVQWASSAGVSDSSWGWSSSADPNWKKDPSGVWHWIGKSTGQSLRRAPSCRDVPWPSVRVDAVRFSDRRETLLRRLSGILMARGFLRIGPSGRHQNWRSAFTSVSGRRHQCAPHSYFQVWVGQVSCLERAHIVCSSHDVVDADLEASAQDGEAPYLSESSTTAALPCCTPPIWSPTTDCASTRPAHRLCA